MGAVRSNELVIDRGEDVWVWDSEVNRYLDATASLWYANIGHGRAEVADAVAAQMKKLAAYSTFGDVANRPAIELAERVSSLAPIPGSKVFLTSGGSDSIDTATKMARRYWQVKGQSERTLFITRERAYHGMHIAGTSLAGIEANATGYGALVGDVVKVAWDSANELREAIASAGPQRVAAFFCEPVIGAGGVYAPPEGYIEGVADLCDEHGILFVVDSVICGFGRLGTWYGIERWEDVRPDMITFAKGVTSGYLPLGGVVVSDRVAAPFFEAPGGPMLRHGATYAGHPACCAAAMAVMDVYERDGLFEHSRELEGELADALAPLADHPAISEVRAGLGLLAAVQLAPEVLEHDAGAVARVAQGAREAGVLVRPLLGAIAMSPPLTVEQEHVDLLAQAIRNGLDSLDSLPARPDPSSGG
jgi:adenosylmethionine-8-amino-7-oxononanoate aminotransferase